MNNRRLEFQTILEGLLGSENVYYRPPENLKMKYPCIRYKKDDIKEDKADNIKYHRTCRYQLTVIDKKPDNPVIEKILDLPMSSYERHYESDNLNHDIIIIYY